MIGQTFELQGKKIWVCGDRGMVGSALVRRLATERCEIITAPRSALDLLDAEAVDKFVQKASPDLILLAAAKVGGILANNSFPADFFQQNLDIQNNVIKSAFKNKVSKLVFLGSSCIYPKLAPQPIREDALLTGPLEPTNEWYAIAKIAGIRQCEAYRRQFKCDFISCMPTNLYGPNDNFDLETSHVLAALIAKAHKVKSQRLDSLEVWGTGTPLREFMHVDDCADAIVFLAKNYSDALHINVGSGEEVSIADLARLVCEVVGISDRLRFDSSKPDGSPRKLMDSTRLSSMGWSPRISLNDGLRAFYDWYASCR